MILALTREQLRSQRRFMIWAAIALALAVGTAVYSALLATSLNAAGDETARALVQDTDQTALGFVGDPVPGVDLPTIPAAELDAAIASAQADGHRVGALATFWNLGIEPAPEDGTSVPWLTAGAGDIDWDAILIEGVVPSAGEVAVSEAYAEKLGIGIGDTVTVYGQYAGPTRGLAIVSGITRSPFDAAGLALTNLPNVWIAWEDLGTLTSLLEQQGNEGLGAAPDVTVSWDGSNRELEQLFSPESITEYTDRAPGVNQASTWIALATVVLSIGAVAMAFAFGRAQAQSRTQWIATARALGATRRHIVQATLIEAGALTLVGTVAGYVLGSLATTAHLAFVHREVPGAGVASSAVLTPIVVAGALVLALTLSLVVAGVPAFWATRVSPTAALKPENDITNSEVGRRVRFWPVTVAWIASGAIAALGADPEQTDGGPLYAVMCSWLFLVLTLIVANEALRVIIPRLARFLSRRKNLAALVAGDSIAARPRQFSVPALLLATGTGAVLFVAWTTIIPRVAEYSSQWPDPTVFDIKYIVPSWLAPASFLVIGLLSVLATIIAVATSAVTTRERDTREALGVSASQTRFGAGIAQAATLGTGILVGAALAAIVVGVFATFFQLDVPDGEFNWALAVEAIGRSLATVLAVGSVLTLASGAIIAAATSSRRTSPSQTTSQVSTHV